MVFFVFCDVLQGVDIWLVAEDYTATNENELSVHRGQQVELLDSSPNGNIEWCLVRVLSTSDAPVAGTGIGAGTGPPSAPPPAAPPSEGLVPMAALKQMPNLKVSTSRTSIENEGNFLLLCHSFL